MYFDFSICDSPVRYGDITLDTIFYINSDHTYNTPAKNITQDKTYFLYTLRGEGIVSYNDHTFTASENTFVYMQPKSDFSYRCKDDKWEFWWFEFFGPCPFQPDQLSHLSVDPFMITLMNKSLQYAKCKSWELATSLFDSINLMIQREADRPQRSANDERLISQIENYIRNNLSTVNVQELTDEFQIEPRTLRNLFNRAIGTTPKHFIMKIRLEYASNLLISTAFSLEQIAQQLGFSSQYHFSKAFKEFYGITPMYYRKYIHLM